MSLRLLDRNVENLLFLLPKCSRLMGEGEPWDTAEGALFSPLFMFRSLYRLRLVIYLARSDDERHISMSLRRLLQKYKIYKKILCWQEIVFDGGGV